MSRLAFGSEALSMRPAKDSRCENKINCKVCERLCSFHRRRIVVDQKFGTEFIHAQPAARQKIGINFIIVLAKMKRNHGSSHVYRLVQFVLEKQNRSQALNLLEANLIPLARRPVTLRKRRVF